MLARCPPSRRSDLVLRHFSDGAVVYDEASGGLHALSPVAGLVLGELMAHESLTTRALAARLQLDEPSPQELDELAAMLRELQSLGFVDCRSA